MSALTDRQLWSARPWRCLFAATVTSVLGDQMSTIALAAYVLRNGSDEWVAGYFLVAAGARVAFGAAGGRWADRFDRRRLLIAADLCRAALMAGLTIAVGFGVGPSMVLAIFGASCTIGSAYRPAFAAMLPAAVPASSLNAANAAEALAHQGGWIVGPLIGAAVAAWVSTAAAVAINACSFVIAACFTARIRLPPGPDESDDDADEEAASQTAPRLARAWTTMSALMLFAMGAEFVLQVALAERRLGLGAEGVGLLVAATGVGGLIGGPLAVRLADKHGNARVLAASMLVVGIGLAGLGQATAWLAMLCCVVEGVGGMLFEVGLAGSIQDTVPTEHLGSVWGRLDAVNAGAQLAGTAAAPALLALMPVSAAVGLIGATVSAGAVVSRGLLKGTKA